MRGQLGVRDLVHKNFQRYVVIDAALGIVERGTYQVADAVAEQPWLPNGPIPLTVEWRLPGLPAGSLPAAGCGRQDGTDASACDRRVGAGWLGRWWIMTRAVVVGSGPNGWPPPSRSPRPGVDVEVLEAADRPGGGTRSSELTLPGLIHDECSGSIRWPSTRVLPVVWTWLGSA